MGHGTPLATTRGGLGRRGGIGRGSGGWGRHRRRRATVSAQNQVQGRHRRRRATVSVQNHARRQHRVRNGSRWASTGAPVLACFAPPGSRDVHVQATDTARVGRGRGHPSTACQSGFAGPRRREPARFCEDGRAGVGTRIIASRLAPPVIWTVMRTPVGGGGPTISGGAPSGAGYPHLPRLALLTEDPPGRKKQTRLGCSCARLRVDTIAGSGPHRAEVREAGSEHTRR